MHLLSLPSTRILSTILPLATFTILLISHTHTAVALNINRDSTIRERSTGITKLRSRQNAHIQAGPFPADDYASTAVSAFSYSNYLASSLEDLVDSQNTIVQVIQTGFQNITLVAEGETGEGYAISYGHPVSSNAETQAASFFSVMLASFVEDISLFNTWAEGISNTDAANVAGQDLALQLASSNEVIACFNLWVEAEGWGGSSLVYVRNLVTGSGDANGIEPSGSSLLPMPELTDSDIITILQKC